MLPLQIGARDMAFPRLNMLSFWVTCTAFVVLVLAFFVQGGAPLGGPVTLEVTAAEVEDRIDQQLLPLDPGGVEVDLLGVAEQPSALVVERKDALLHFPDLQRDVEFATLGTHRGAGGRGPR